MYAAIEGGGTKFIVALFEEGSSEARPLAQTTIPTTEPDETLGGVAAFLKNAQADHGPISAIGVASFGPLCLDKSNSQYGCIVNTPKPGWSDCNLVSQLQQHIKAPVVLDSDVNAAALAEYHLRQSKGNLVYITVGTGVGVGVAINGLPLHGRLHPELGHLPASPGLGEVAGVCPFHENCVEGLASGHALTKRWKVDLKTCDPQHPLWESAAECIAQLCVSCALAYSPECIVLGGGVIDSGNLHERVRSRFKQQMGGYLPAFAVADTQSPFLDLPKSGSVPPGLYGAYLLAKNSSKNEKSTC